MKLPVLKTGAVAQYPAERRLEYRTEVVRFADGSEQRYREAGALRRWVIRLDLLNEAEMAALAEFFEANQGAVGSFEFIDPWSGTAYPDCSVEGDALELEWVSEGRGRGEVVIRENR